MYCLGNHPEISVVDEPLYAHYLTHQETNAAHPGKAEILASQVADGAMVVQQMLETDYGTPLVVFKQMTHHLIEIDTTFLNEMINVLLIRDPRAILASFSKVVSGVVAEDIGVPQQYDLYHQLEAKGQKVYIVDARKLLENPTMVIMELCDQWGVTFTPSMLTWPAGAREEDGVWAKHWYTNVHKSTGFLPFTPKEYILSPELECIARKCTPLYQEMLAMAL